MNIKLKEEIKKDKEMYKCRNIFVDIYKYLTHNQIKFYRKVVIVSRKYRWYRSHNGILNKLFMILYAKKFNVLARKSHINIQGKFGEGLKIWHENIIVNRFAQLGNNVNLHGNNCIGNNGKDIEKCPKIGNNVDIGYGATIIGDIVIADNIVIGANSLVNKSFTTPGITIAGVPAREIKRKGVSHE